MIPVPAVVNSPILVGRPMQTEFMGHDILTQTENCKTYEISVQTDVVPELVKLKLLNDVNDKSGMKASFLGVMQKGQKRRRMMTMIGGVNEEDQDIEVEDDDPFLSVQKDLAIGL